MAALGVRCGAQAFCCGETESCGERGLLFAAVRGVSHCGVFSCCGAWAPGARASVIVARRL